MRRALGRGLAALSLVTAGCLGEYVYVATEGSATTTGAAGSGTATSATGSTHSASTEAPCVMCNGRCVEPDSDPEHCGACGVACAPPAICVAGSCQALDCEFCDNGTELCVGGECLCKPGLDRCEEACVDLGTDPLHCGGCGQGCGARHCVAGSCQETCDSLDMCGSVCVDVSENPLHCGQCDNVCVGDSLCVDGDCPAFSVGACEACPCPASCHVGTICCEVGLVSVLCIEGDDCPS